MGGGHGADALLMKVIQYGHGQRRSLSGICTCTELIKEAEAGDISVFKYGHDIRHMGREGGKGLLYGLLIPDVRIYFFEERELAPVSGGDMEPGKPHEFQ